MSSVIDLKLFRYTKRTLDNLKDTTDNDWRVDWLDFLDDSNKRGGYEYFYDLMPNIRFMDDTPDHIAYTTPDIEIYVNTPGSIVGKDERCWDFIYAHECMHQLWDTFGVGEEIKKSEYEYNHMILNIASDCIINDFLRRNLKKKPFTDGIFPETLKENYGVEYDRDYDTQFSLYVKLLTAVKEKQELEKQLQNDSDKLEKQEGGQGNHSRENQEGQGQQGGQQQQQDQQGQQGNQQGNQSGGQSGNSSGDSGVDSDNETGNGLPNWDEMSDDFKAGWEQAVKDYEDGKIKL